MRPIRSFINNNAWAILCAISAVLVGYVYAVTDKRYTLRTEYEVEVAKSEAQEQRLNAIETKAEVAASTSIEVNRKLDKTQGDVENINRQLNRLVGAFEARGLIPPQSSP